MSGRLPAGLVAGALLRRVDAAGGFAAVLARGDPQAGGLLLVVSERGGPERVLERGIGLDGTPALIDSTPREDVEGYWRRRRGSDPDLWVIALDIADAERFAAETMLAD